MVSVLMLTRASVKMGGKARTVPRPFARTIAMVLANVLPQTLVSATPGLKVLSVFSANALSIALDMVSVTRILVTARVMRAGWELVVTTPCATKSTHAANMGCVLPRTSVSATVSII